MKLKTGAVTILTSMIIGLIGWAGFNISANGNRLTKVETEKTYIIKKLDKIDLKLDRVLER